MQQVLCECSGFWERTSFLRLMSLQFRKVRKDALMRPVQGIQPGEEDKPKARFSVLRGLWMQITAYSPEWLVSQDGNIKGCLSLQPSNLMQNHESQLFSSGPLVGWGDGDGSALTLQTQGPKSDLHVKITQCGN